MTPIESGLAIVSSCVDGAILRPPAAVDSHARLEAIESSQLLQGPQSHAIFFQVLHKATLLLYLYSYQHQFLFPMVSVNKPLQARCRPSPLYNHCACLYKEDCALMLEMRYLGLGDPTVDLRQVVRLPPVWSQRQHA